MHSISLYSLSQAKSLGKDYYISRKKWKKSFRKDIKFFLILKHKKGKIGQMSKMGSFT